MKIDWKNFLLMIPYFHFACLFFLSWAVPVSAQIPTQPNVVIVLTDDQGYGDLACHGNPYIKTPNKDALHARSVRFTNFHSGTTCAPPAPA